VLPSISHLEQRQQDPLFVVACHPPVQMPIPAQTFLLQSPFSRLRIFQKISDEQVYYETCVTESKQELPIVCLDETRDKRRTKGRQDEAPSPSTAANSERREDASFIPSLSSSSGVL
jgi:hypothetical protein